MTGHVSVHPHPLAAQPVTRRAGAPLSCNATLRQVGLDPVTRVCGVRDGFWYLAAFRTVTPLQRWSTRRFTYLWRVGSIVSCASGDDEHRRSPSSEWGWERRMGDHIMGCRARGGRGAFMVRSWVGRVHNLGCISGFTPSLVAPKLPVHRCTPSGDVRYRLVHHNHMGSAQFRAPAATPLSLSGHPGVGRVSRAETARLARAIVLRTLARVRSRFAERLGA